MIQYWLKDQLAAALPGLRITVDYEADADTFATVFYEGGGEPARYDIKYRYPRYMVWIESADWGYAQFMAREVFETFHEYHQKVGRPTILVEYLDANNQLLGSEHVRLHSLQAATGPNHLGVDNGKMRYSVNFDAVITKQEEETTNG